MQLKYLLDVRYFLDCYSSSNFIDYSESLQAMKELTSARNEKTRDEFWVLEHKPVFTLGKTADESQIIYKNNIQLVRSDRGGQVTYHSPGQLMIYNFIDLKRKNISVRYLVESLEKGIIKTLENYDIEAYGDRKAPGVYVENKKIASLGLRISRGCSYHGLCFNFDFDAKPFTYINPCGISGLKITQLRDLVNDMPNKRLFAEELIENISHKLDYLYVNHMNEHWKIF
jgi:lipoyl(octanoyl) transferase